MFRVSALIIFLFFSTHLAAQQVYTLQQCIDSALANYIPIKQADVTRQTARIELGQSRSNLLPDLNADVWHGYNSGRSIDPFTNSYVNQNVKTANYGVLSNLTLFKGLSLQNTIRQKSFAYESASMSYQQVKDRLVLDVLLAYLDVLNGEDQVELAIKREETSQKTLDRLQVLDKQGAVKPSEVTDLEGQVLADQLTILDARSLLESFKLALSQLMNKPYDPNMKLERITFTDALDRYPKTPIEVFQNSLNQFALVKAAELNTRSYQYGVKAAKGELYPSLGLQGGINTNYSSVAQNATGKIPYGSQLKNNRFTSVGVGVSIPIFNRMFARNQVKLAENDYTRASLQEQNFKRELHEQIDDAYLKMTNAYDRFQLLAQQVKAYESSFRAAETRYNAGVGTSIDYITAKDRYDQAEINLLSARYAYLLRTRILDFYNGK
jgi:outer membrane protein